MHKDRVLKFKHKSLFRSRGAKCYLAANSASDEDVPGTSVTEMRVHTLQNSPHTNPNLDSYIPKGDVK